MFPEVTGQWVCDTADNDSLQNVSADLTSTLWKPKGGGVAITLTKTEITFSKNHIVFVTYAAISVEKQTQSYK